MLPPAHLFPFAATTTDVTLYTGTGILLGFSFAETAGAAAQLTVNDGPDDTYPEILRVNFAANGYTQGTCGPAGVLIRTGLFVEILSGTAEGSLWLLPVTNAYDRSWAHGDLGVYRIRD